MYEASDGSHAVFRLILIRRNVLNGAMMRLMDDSVFLS